MQKVLTAEQMREVDRSTTERFGIPSIVLMENAAHAVYRVVNAKLGGSARGKSILILCGRGNNGGDGAALARILWEAGAFVSFMIFGRVADTRGDARTNLDILRSFERDVSTSGGEFNKLLVHEDDEDLVSMLEMSLSGGGTDLVIDALFGTGLQRKLEGDLAEVIRRLDNHRPEIISIDLPSGLDADRGSPIGPNVNSTCTVTFTAPKTANVVAPASNSNGELIVANIGSPQELIDEQPSLLFVAEESDAGQWLERTAFASGDYKNKRGHSLIIAGSEDYSGAAVMCGNSAMRSGVGLTTLLVPASCRVEIASRIIPEVIVRALAETGGVVTSDAFEANRDAIAQSDSILVGPGLKATDKGVAKLIREIVENRTTPVIVDAGALWCFSSDPLKKLRRPDHPDGSAVGDAAPLILTPHEGEFLRLLGTDGKAALEDRVAAARAFAVDHQTILVLKGERVLTASPDGRVVVNPTGNSGLGKAGNGDTLSGILAGATAQAAKRGIDIFETVTAAVYLAGMAGDAAEKLYGKRVMTASDVRECLTAVFEYFERK